MRTLLILVLLSVSSISAEEQKLKMVLHIEGLCPDSVNTVVESYGAAIEKGLLEMADVTFNIAGNASYKRASSGKVLYNYECQHGIEECYLNMLELCMIKNLNNSRKALETVVCMYNQTHTEGSLIPIAFEKCTMYYDWELDQKKTALECSVNGEGQAMMLEAIDNTPKHDFIPWTVVDGKTLTVDDRTLINVNVFQYACNNFMGEKPETCNEGGNDKRRFISMLD